MIQKRTIYLSSIILVLLLLCGLLSVSAGSEKMFTALYFSNSTAGNCGIDATHGPWYAAYTSYDSKDWVRVWSPGIAHYKVTDGKNRVVVEGQQEVGVTANVSRSLNGFGLQNVDWSNAVNPIHVVIHFDDDLAGDLTADNPCLAGGGGKPSSSSSSGQGSTTNSQPAAPAPNVTFSPPNVKIPQDPADHLILRCGYDRIYISGTAGNSGVLKLATLRLKTILAAGDGGLTKNVGTYGSLNMKHLGSGNFVVTWSGGNLGADGQAANGFAKSFTCTFK